MNGGQTSSVDMAKHACIRIETESIGLMARIESTQQEYNAANQNANVLKLLRNVIYQVLIICYQFGIAVTSRFWNYLDSKGIIQPIDYAISLLADHPFLKIILVVLSSICLLPIIGFAIYAFVTFGFFGVAYVIVLGFGAVVAIPIFISLILCLSLTAALVTGCYIVWGAVRRAIDLENINLQNTGTIPELVRQHGD